MPEPTGTTKAYNGQSAVWSAFDETNNAHRVNIVAGGSAPGDTPVYINKLPFNSDAVQGSILSPTQEQYNYKTGGLSGTSVAIATVTYLDAFKDFVSSVEIST